MVAGANTVRWPEPATLEARERVLVVANRLPVTIRREGGVLRSRPSVGGLARGLRHVAREWPVVWFGWYGLAEEESPPTPTLVHAAEAGSTVSISLTEAEVARFYRRYCNSVLWPVLHGWTDEVPDAADWNTYRSVNERYASAVLRHLQPGDKVWVHDFHLFLVPGLVRRARAGAPIAFFLHTPFPEPGTFAELPQAEELFAGALGADVLGFHTDQYAENFLRTAASMGYSTRGREVRVGDRSVRARVKPMGIDAESFSRLGRDPGVLAVAAELREPGTRVLLGVDRLDYTKGIPQRLLAFERLLELHPELRGKVSLLQIAVPSREEIGIYRDLREVVEALVGRINLTFARPDWIPVNYFHMSVDLDTLAALYTAADVMLITSRCDGLNLVAKEFIATRADGDGVLVLSKFAGAAAELESALHVDPNSVGELAHAYLLALTMPEKERRRRMRDLRRTVASNDVFQWAAEILDHLPVLRAENA